MTKGYYGGGTFGVPTPIGGVGGGLYMDNYGRIYPQVYWGTPKFSFSAGYTPDLEGLLTGLSISGSPGVGPIRPNVGANLEAVGGGIGTPGVGVTHGFGPLEMSNDYSRPWTTPSIRDSAARARVPSRYNVFEHGYPDSNMVSSLPDAAAGSNDSPFADSNGSSPRAADEPSRRPGRGTYSQSQEATFDHDASTPPAPMQRLGSLSLNDAYLEYLKRLNAYQTQASASDESVPEAPLVPADDSIFSGGLLGRLTALMGIDPQNPPPPQDNDLRGFYRDDPQQPWFLGR